MIMRYSDYAPVQGLSVFENLKEIELTDEQIGHFDYYFHGVDWGYFPDPMGIYRNGV